MAQICPENPQKKSLNSAVENVRRNHRRCEHHTSSMSFTWFQRLPWQCHIPYVPGSGRPQTDQPPKPVAERPLVCRLLRKTCWLDLIGANYQPSPRAKNILIVGDFCSKPVASFHILTYSPAAKPVEKGPWKLHRPGWCRLQQIELIGLWSCVFPWILCKLMATHQNSLQCAFFHSIVEIWQHWGNLLAPKACFETKKKLLKSYKIMGYIPKSEIAIQANPVLTGQLGASHFQDPIDPILTEILGPSTDCKMDRIGIPMMLGFSSYLINPPISSQTHPRIEII